MSEEVPPDGFPCPLCGRILTPEPVPPPPKLDPFYVDDLDDDDDDFDDDDDEERIRERRRAIAKPRFRIPWHPGQWHGPGAVEIPLVASGIRWKVQCPMSRMEAQKLGPA